MWNDVETVDDLLNFNITADVAANLIRESAGQPVSIGVSGRWGTGKSSLVKMIGASLKKGDSDNNNYLFIEFNAWLYQGYDDARMALLQTVADNLLSEAEKRKTCVDKVESFMKRINWFRVGKMVAPVVSSAVIGGTVGGPVGAILGVVGGIIKSGATPTEDDIKKLKDAYDNIKPDLKGFLLDDSVKSLPKEIAALRDSFSKILEELGITLVVLVDDLDRCLPTTAISTLEAMRLLLFLPRTAFIIAADERMIRNAVRFHFGDINLDDDLVTSYFDKLIQIPIRVPRLGISEVKAYLMLLFADLSMRLSIITEETYEKGKDFILNKLRKSWTGGITRNVLKEAYGEEASKINRYIDLADQLAPLMATTNKIAGNPRLIKRFLNNLLIKDNVARAHGMSLSFEVLVKMQLFERCAPVAAFDSLAKAVADSDDGKPVFLQELEAMIATGKEYAPKDKNWTDPFIEEWMGINPPLADIDLRPLLHLSRDRSIILASYDELSTQAQELLAALIDTSRFDTSMIKPIQNIGETEAERILNRLIRKSRNNGFDFPSIKRALHIPKAFPSLGKNFTTFLNEIPYQKRNAPLIPLIKNEPWAQDILSAWFQDEQSPSSVKKAINK